MIANKKLTTGLKIDGIDGPFNDGFFRVHTVITNLGAHTYTHDDEASSAHTMTYSPVCVILYDAGQQLFAGAASTGKVLKFVKISNFIKGNIESITIQLKNVLITGYRKIDQACVDVFDPTELLNIISQEGVDGNTNNTITNYLTKLEHDSQMINRMNRGASRNNYTSYLFLNLMYTKNTTTFHQYGDTGKSAGSFVTEFETY